MELIDAALAVFRQLQPAAYVQISPFIRTSVLDPDGRGKLVPDKLIRRFALCIGTKIAKIVQHLSSAVWIRRIGLSVNAFRFKYAFLICCLPVMFLFAWDSTRMYR